MTSEWFEDYRAEVLDSLEAAWGIIANSGGGNWKFETFEWQEAAARWRDQYFALVERAKEKP